MSERITARERAAQCWCDPSVSDREMDTALCEVIAKAIDQACAEARDAAIKERAEGWVGGALLGRKEGYTRGYSDAREAALKVCRTSLEYEWAANQIEALQPSPEREGKRD